MGEHILVGAPGPEEARQGDVDGDQGRSEKRDVAAEQTEAGIDVTREDLGKAVDDPGVHVSSLVEHLHGLRLVAPAGCEKLIELHPPLFLVCGEARAFEALGAGLRCNQRGQVDELPRLQGDQLVAGLARLEDADSRLARCDEPIGLGARGIQRLHHAGLDTERILVSGQRVLPARLGVTDELL